jgi:Ca2+-binding RTX toxin-like protein
LRQRSNGVPITLALVAAASMLFAAVATAATILGTDNGERLIGTNGPDRIDARAGDDLVFAMGGRDRVRGGGGNDELHGGRNARGGSNAGAARRGRHGFWRLGFLGRRGDRLHGNAGNDRVFGGRGRDFLTGNAGDDELRGGPGRDGVWAGPGNDQLFGGGGPFFFARADRLHGGEGDDTSTGGRGADFMSGGLGNDTQNGGAGRDLIFANPGRDVSHGGAGNDVLWALARADVTSIGDQDGDLLTGGDGNDRFRVRDGEVDAVHCGAGQDRVLADQLDAVDPDCESVVRRDVTSLEQVDDREETRQESPRQDSQEG